VRVVYDNTYVQITINGKCVRWQQKEHDLVSLTIALCAANVLQSMENV